MNQTNVLEDDRWLKAKKVLSPKKDEVFETDVKWLLAGRKVATPDFGEDIVITGMSGCFPESANIEDFHDNLANKADMVTQDTRRWESTHPEIPKRAGKILNVTKFDAGFFGVHRLQADALDPLCRILMEKTYECILDAGVHPAELVGTNTGVFIGACASESEKYWMYDALEAQRYQITGCHRSMLATRISYFFKLKGPSLVMDTACSSSFFAFEKAYKSIRENKCDRAIVAGANLCLHPFVTLQFARLGVLSLDGACKCFDDSANGYTRSEAICAILLQKSKESKRIYAEIIHSKVNADGYKEEGITYPSGDTQMNLIKEVYQESNIDPSDISFMEAHGTGTRVGDPEELKAIDEVFVKCRKRPLLIGSVKSNIGHTEPSSGLCSIVKVVLGMENGYILPNKNFLTPRRGIESLASGKLVVVTEKTAWPDNNGLVGINSFGFGGGNCHTILRWHKKIKTNHGQPNDNLPRLICVNSRVAEGIDTIFDYFKGRKLDAEFVRILHEIYSKHIPDYNFHGFAIISKAGELFRASAFLVESPVDFYVIFGGLDPNWGTLAKDLMEFKVFAATIYQLHNILIEKEINLTEILINFDPSNILHVTLITVACQIGLWEILKSVNATPNAHKGCHLGELAAAYSCNLLSAKECILAAYFAVTVSTVNQLRHELQQFFPSESAPNETSFTFEATPTNLVDHFARSLLLNACKASEISLDVPKNALVLNIGFNCVKMHSSINALQLIDFDNSLGSLAVLKGLGSLFNAGVMLQLDNLYPVVNWPVSRGTAMVSPLIKWDHTRDWFVTTYRTQDIIKTGHRQITVSLQDEYWRFLGGHIVDGRNLFPATGYLNVAWEVLGLITGKMPTNMNVIFENVKFLRASNIPEKGKLDFVVMVQRGSGNFEVVEGGVAIVTGRIYELPELCEDWTKLPAPVADEDEFPLKEKDIYKELRLRGYHYKGAFKAIKECDNTGSIGKIEWTGNWIAFMDNMLQMQILQQDSRNLYVPTCIKEIVIHATRHVNLGKANNLMTIHVHKNLDLMRSGGIEVRGLIANSIPRRKLPQTVLETYKFVPNHTNIDLNQSVRVNLQIALENFAAIKLKIIELHQEHSSYVLGPIIQTVLGDQPLIEADISVLTKAKLEFTGINVENKNIGADHDCYLICVTELFADAELQKSLLKSLKSSGYILTQEALDFELQNNDLPSFQILTIHRTTEATIILLRHKDGSKIPPTNVINLTNNGMAFDWLQDLQKSIKTESTLVCYAQNEVTSGILGFVNCARREPNLEQTKCFYVNGDCPPFNLDHEFYKKQFQIGLAINVFENNSWGTYRHLELAQNPSIRADHCYVNATVRGDLSSLRWLQGPLEKGSTLEANHTLVQVHYSAINFRDVMTASGRVSVDAVTRNRLLQECVQGFEYSGRDESGRRVMGMNISGALASQMSADKFMLIDMPKQWTMAEAVTVPVVYNTVFYAFFMRSTGLKKGQKILIHSGTGGVGQAAINIASHYGCTIFTTVGTEEKRQFILENFPQIRPEHIGNSRDTSFEQMIQTQTHGRGVDIILNSLAEEKLLASVRCLSRGGTFFEIGKFDLANDNQLPLELTARGAKFHGIMLDALFSGDVRLRIALMKLLNDGIANGSVKPLPKTCFKKDEVEKAFRFMATGKHIGKVIVQIRDEETQADATFLGIPRYYCVKSNVSIIIGGLGGFGLELADWLILRGARNLVLTSRNGIKTGYQAMRIRTWQSYGATIKIIINDLKSGEACREMLQSAQELGPIEAIFNLAVVLKDALLENQSIDTFQASFAAKAEVTRFLDIQSRELCPNLKTFVVFSSVSCGRGNAGQTNYGLSNSVMERICEQRNKANFPALAIQWGAIGDVGLVAEMQEDHTERAIGGTLQQRISSCLEVMDQFLRQSETIVSSMVVAEKRSGSGGADNMVDAVVNILGLRDLKTVSLHSSLAELGMDSMMAVEIKQTLEREYEVFLTPQDIRTLSFARLQEIALEKDSTDASIKPKSVRTEKTEGVRFLLRFINNEECSKIPLITLPSLVGRIDAPKIFFLPGVEGFASILEPLCKQISAHCLCLQFTYENPKDTIEEMAQMVLHEMLKHLTKNESFHLVAYSYGCIIALELVKALEELGFVGKLIFIDGAYGMMSKLLRQHINLNSDAEFQTSLLCNIFSLYTNLDIIDSYKLDLLRLTNYEDRVKFVQDNSPATEYSREYIRQVCVAFFKRISALVDYKPNDYLIKSKLSLFRPARASVIDIETDYQLGEICETPIDVKFFEGDHYTILENPLVAQAIDALFQAKILPKSGLNDILEEPKAVEYAAM